MAERHSWVHSATRKPTPKVDASRRSRYQLPSVSYYWQETEYTRPKPLTCWDKTYIAQRTERPDLHTPLLAPRAGGSNEQPKVERPKNANTYHDLIQKGRCPLEIRQQYTIPTPYGIHERVKRMTPSFSRHWLRHQEHIQQQDPLAASEARVLKCDEVQPTPQLIRQECNSNEETSLRNSSIEIYEHGSSSERMSCISRNRKVIILLSVLLVVMITGGMIAAYEFVLKTERSPGRLVSNLLKSLQS